MAEAYHIDHHFARMQMLVQLALAAADEAGESLIGIQLQAALSTIEHRISEEARRL